MAKKRINENLRDKILEIAQELLQKKSFSDISLNNIADGCGISKGTLYYYYKNKDDIIFDIYEKYIDSLWEELIVWINNKEKDTSLHRVAKFVIIKGTDESGVRLNLINDATNGNEKLRKRMVEKYNSFVAAFYERLKKEMDDEQAEFLSWLFLIMSDGVNIQKFMKNDNFNGEKFTKLTESYFRKTENVLKK